MEILETNEDNISENAAHPGNDSLEIVAAPNNPETADSGQNASAQSTEIVEVGQSAIQPVTNENEDKLTALFEDFTAQLKETNRLSQERETVIDRLHQENQRLKQGEIQQALLPVFRDLIRLYDDLNTTVSKYAGDPAARDGKLVRDLDCYKETVGDILYRYGVEPVEVKTGEDFNPKEHKAVAVAPAETAQQDRKISKIIRNGFKTETKIIRNAEVEVYRYSAPMTAENLETQNENKPEVFENQSEAK